jgi:hypothetical protein
MVLPTGDTCRQFPNLAVADGEWGAWQVRNKHCMDSMGRKMRNVWNRHQMQMPTCDQHCSTASISGIDIKAQRLVVPLTGKHARWVLIYKVLMRVVAAPPKINQGPLLRADYCEAHLQRHSFVSYRDRPGPRQAICYKYE